MKSTNKFNNRLITKQLFYATSQCLGSLLGYTELFIYVCAWVGDFEKCMWVGDFEKCK